MRARGAGKRGAGLRTAAAASLALPLWLGACVAEAPPGSMPAPSAPLAISRSTPAAPPPATPAPQLQDPARTETSAPPARSLNQASAGFSAGAGPSAPAADFSTPSTPGPGSPGPSTAAPQDLGDAAVLRASERPGPTNTRAAPHTVTAYYVLLDDGGRNGVRFGCNDSLVGVSHESSSAGEALPAAVGALLDSSGSAAVGAQETEADLYNSLASSRLKFLSGSFDGTTVTVYLAGTLRPGGACDLPRLEAQLTQTAVAAVGAIRAEIYVNGVTLAEVLRLD